MLDATSGKLHAHAPLVLINSLEVPAQVITRLIDGRAQKPLQAIPRCKNLPQWSLMGNPAFVVDGDSLRHLDAKVPGASAARLQGLQELRMTRNSGSASDKLDVRALIDIRIPCDLAQESGREQSRHRAANNDGPSLGAARRGRTRHVWRS